jgi:hypothetical protein
LTCTTKVKPQIETGANSSVLATVGIVLGDHHPNIPGFPPNFISQSDAASPAGIGWFPTIQKGLTTNARFLRDEAARFRGMAEDAERAATKVRLLAMAADYDARAKVAHESEEPNSGEASGEAVEPTPNEAPRITPGRKITTGLKEPVLVQRRPVGQPRRE